MIERCEAGCMVFTGGEIRHDKNCIFYPESLTKLNADKIDKLKKETAKLKLTIEKLKEQLVESKNILNKNK